MLRPRFWDARDQTIPGSLSLSRSRGREEERPWERGCDKGSWFDQPSQIGEEKHGDEQCSTASESVVVISRKKKMMETNLPEERKVSFLDHVYLRHLSTEYRSILSAYMSTEYRPTCRPTCRSSIGRHVIRVNRLSVDTIGRYVGRHSADISADMSLVYRSTVGGVSVDCRWSVNRCFVEIPAVSLPTGDAKGDSIPYARVLVERRCSSNCRHFEYISNAT